MTSSFRPATRRQLKLRMALDGPSGAGKTYTALRLAFALAPNRRIAVIGTEGSESDDAAEKYVGEADPDHPGQTWQFDLMHLTSFSPSEYAAAIEEAGRRSYELVIVDSLSHAWEGKDGALDLKDRKGGNSFTAWKDITPMHRRMIDSILNSPCHVIATMRSKTEYVLEKNDQGKDVPRKVGTAPIQRSGMEYEFDVYGSLDWSHIMTVTKTRCRAIDGQIVAKPGAAFMQPIIAWLQTGVQEVRERPSARISDEQVKRIAGLLDAIGWNVERIKGEFPRKYQCTELGQLSRGQADSLIGWLEGHAKGKVAKEPATNGTAANGTAASATNGTTPHAAAMPPAEPKQMITTAQIQSLLSLRSLCGLADKPEDWQSRLTPYKVRSGKELTEAQASALIYELEKESAAKMTNERKEADQAATVAAKS